ncbi:MAG: hypothetical protein NT027_15220 [Proteobacteria bacterium]|nr:hypothetical protein [Pseudomonadota bacterium]
MFFYERLIIVAIGCTALVNTELTPLFAQDFAARILGKKRYANDSAVNPNANAIQAPASQNEFIEEDLTTPGSGSSTKKSVKILPPEPPTDMSDSDSEVQAKPVPPPSKTLPPEAWDPRTNKKGNGEAAADTGRDHAGDVDDGDIGISAGVGFGGRSFSANLGFSFPIYRWLGWNISGSYYTKAWDDKKETIYGPEGSLIVRIPSRIPITPFAGVGLGYDKWTRSIAEKKFDDSASLLSLYYVGISIPMASHLAFNISQTWKTYLGRPPKTFEDESKYEPYSYKRFNVGFALVF